MCTQEHRWLKKHTYTHKQLTVVEAQFQNILKQGSLVSWELWTPEAWSLVSQERAGLSQHHQGTDVNGNSRNCCCLLSPDQCPVLWVMTTYFADSEFYNFLQFHACF